MGLMPYTHYVSVIFCFGLFFADCVMIFRKSSGLRVIVSYFIGALMFIPWALILLPAFSRNFASFWPSPPGIKRILSMGKWLTCYPSVFLIGMLCIIWHLYGKYSRREKFSVKSLFISSEIFASVFMVTTIYIYSRYIHPHGGFFVNRYFFPIIPFTVLTVTYGMNFIYERLCTNYKKLIFAVIFLTIIMDDRINSAFQQNFHSEPYREAAQYISRNEAEKPGAKSAIITTDDIAGTSVDALYVHYGWEEMYLGLYPETKFMSAYCLPMEIGEHREGNMLGKLQENNYDRIYFCFLRIPLSSNKSAETQEIMKWLHEKYDFGDHNEKYKFQILEVRR